MSTPTTLGLHGMGTKYRVHTAEDGQLATATHTGKMFLTYQVLHILHNNIIHNHILHNNIIHNHILHNNILHNNIYYTTI